MKKILGVLAVAILVLATTGCGPSPAGDIGTEIIDAEEALALVAQGGAVLVDANNGVTYNKRHAAGAVSIPRTAITINDPVPNMLAPADTIEDVMSQAGVGNDTMVIAYDDNGNMDAARLWWTLKVYGHDSVKVVSGGLLALAAAGAQVTDVALEPTPSSFSASAPRSEMIAVTSEVRTQVENPAENVVIIDTRTMEEVAEGTIPGSIHLNFTGNNFSDGTFKPVRHIRIRYLEEGIDYHDQAILFCKTSIRGAQTYLALYNAGYRDLKLYDGAWVQWEANPMNPVQIPEDAALNLNAADQS